MTSILTRYLQERAEWQSAFDDLLKFGSEGLLESEILQAKKIFFSRLGSTHEMREDLYEVTSQTFLEWYLFDYQTWVFSKSPAVVYVTLNLGTPNQRKWIETSLFEHWSLYEVLQVRSEEIELQDLLFRKKRRVAFDPEAFDVKAWRVKTGQVIQARLFELESRPFHFLTHLWIHGDDEKDRLKRLCRLQSKKWSRHKGLLLETFEAVVRSTSIQGQIRAARGSNWLYEELAKKYAA
jgi:hypothetical protein